MNQNFNNSFYSDKVLKGRTYKKIHAEIFLSEPGKGVKKLKVRSQPMASGKKFSK